MAFSDIATARLVVRALRPADAEAVFRYRSDPEVCRFQIWEPSSLAEVDDFIARMIAHEPDTPGTWYQLAICERETGRLVGDCGLHFPVDREHEAEFGVSLAPEFQGRGYATEAVGAVLGYLFDTLRKHRVFASVDPRNYASVRLLERIGMRREAHFRETLWVRGEWVDDAVYAMLRREWEGRRSRPHRTRSTPGDERHRG